MDNHGYNIGGEWKCVAPHTTITFRVSRIWRTYNTDNGGLDKLQFIAIDIKQRAFLCLIEARFVPMFEDRVKEGFIYSIKEFKLAKMAPLYRILHNARAFVVIDFETKLNKLSVDVPFIISHKFRLIPFNELLNVSKNNANLCDVIGEITMFSVREKQHIPSTTLRTVHAKLYNLRGESLNVEFNSLESSVVLNIRLQRTGRICILASMYVILDPDGSIVVSASDASRIYASFNIEEIREFHDRCSKFADKEMLIEEYECSGSKSTVSCSLIGTEKSVTKGIHGVGGTKASHFSANAYDKDFLHDDSEWNEAIEEASLWATGPQLRNLFLTIALFCHVSDVSQLWAANLKRIGSDIQAISREKDSSLSLITDLEDCERLTLAELESVMHKNGGSIEDIEGLALLRDKCSGNLETTGVDNVQYEIVKVRECHDIIYDE